MHFSKLKIWERGLDLAQVIYAMTKKLPKEELYGLVSQMRRAAVSIPSNIAEGSQRTTDRDFANFVLIARGSLAELQTQLLLCRKLGYVADEEAKKILVSIDELSRMLHSFHSKLTAQSS